jgi:hypothetical protein
MIELLISIFPYFYTDFYIDMNTFQSNSKKGSGEQAAGQYQLSELELPTKRINGMGGPFSSASPGKSVLADMIYSLELVKLICNPALNPKLIQ